MSRQSRNVWTCVIIYLITAPKKSWLHPNDGLVVLRKANGRTIDLCRKNIISIFETLEFITNIQTNLKIVDFLDITFDLEMEHMTVQIIICPSTLIKSPTTNYQTNSKFNWWETVKTLFQPGNQEVFEKSKAEYEVALLKSEYSAKLSYTNNIFLNHSTSNRSSNSLSFSNHNTNKNRKCNIIWFNPPFSMNVKNNIGKNFIQLIDKHFPCSSKLHKIFKRNTVNVSYSYTPNFRLIIRKQ